MDNVLTLKIGSDGTAAITSTSGYHTLIKGPAGTQFRLKTIENDFKMISITYCRKDD